MCSPRFHHITYLRNWHMLQDARCAGVIICSDHNTIVYYSQGSASERPIPQLFNLVSGWQQPCQCQAIVLATATTYAASVART